jgi:hypothetical protein
MGIEKLELVRDKLRQMDAPQSLLAVLSGVAAPDLSSYLNRLSGPDEKVQRIYQKTLALEKMVEKLRPFPLDFRESAQIKTLIEKMELGDIDVFVREKEHPADRLEFFNILLGVQTANNIFYGRRGGRILGSPVLAGAPKYVKEVADQLIIRLRQTGFPKASSRSCGYDNSFACTADEAWTEEEPKPISIPTEIESQ